MKKEIEELGKINKLAEIHGNYRIENQENSHLLPIFMQNDCRELIISQIKDIVNFCENQTS